MQEAQRTAGMLPASLSLLYINRRITKTHFKRITPIFKKQALVNGLLRISIAVACDQIKTHKMNSWSFDVSLCCRSTNFEIGFLLMCLRIANQHYVINRRIHIICYIFVISALILISYFCKMVLQ